jgi:hypothetical protein
MVPPRRARSSAGALFPQPQDARARFDLAGGIAGSRAAVRSPRVAARQAQRVQPDRRPLATKLRRHRSRRSHRAAAHRTQVVERDLTGARASTRGDDSAPGYDVELHLRVHLALARPAEERWSSLPRIIAQLCRASWPSSGERPHKHYKRPQACDAYPDERECSGHAATDLGPVPTGRPDFHRSTFDDAHRGFTVPRSGRDANRRPRESPVWVCSGGRGFGDRPARSRDTRPAVVLVSPCCAFPPRPISSTGRPHAPSIPPNSSLPTRAATPIRRHMHPSSTQRVRSATSVSPGGRAGSTTRS